MEKYEFSLRQKDENNLLEHPFTLESRADEVQLIHYEIYSQKPRVDPASGAPINTVSRGEMPHGVEAYYLTYHHQITMPADVHEGSTKHTSNLKHESMHATYKTTNEYQTDYLEANETGHFEYVRNGINEHKRI